MRGQLGGEHQTLNKGLTMVPRTPLTVHGERGPKGVQTADKLIIVEDIEDLLAHAGHDAHAGHHVGRVCALDADLGQRAAHRTHAEWDHVHRATCLGWKTKCVIFWGVEVRKVCFF